MKLSWMLLTILVVVSCKESLIKSEYQQLKASKIVLHENFLVLNQNKVDINSKANNYKLIHFVPSFECSECAIANISQFNRLDSISKATGAFSLMVVFSPRADMAEHIIKLLNENSLSYNFPVYIDINNQFQKLNPSIPTSTILHTFLINNDGTPVFIGNPLANKKLFNLFTKKLNLKQSDL